MTRSRSETGATLLEVLAVIAVIGISVGATALNLKPLEGPLYAGSSLLEGFMRQARLNAIATTSAYRVVPASTTSLDGETAASCSETTWTADPSMNLDLPQGVNLSSTGWSVCFSSRGISSGNVLITLEHDTFGKRTVEVMVGGTTRVIE